MPSRIAAVRILGNGYSSLPAQRGHQARASSARCYLMFFVVSSRSRWASGPRSTWRSTPATRGSTRFINTNIRNLAGVPAIVYGILGLAVFVKLLKRASPARQVTARACWPAG